MAAPAVPVVPLDDDSRSNVRDHEIAHGFLAALLCLLHTRCDYSFGEWEGGHATDSEY